MNMHEERFEFDKGFAERMIIERGDLVSMFHVHARDGDTYSMPSGARDSDEQMAIYRNIRMACVVYEAEALTAMTEAWMRVLPPNASADEIAKGARDQPDKIEVVVVSHFWIEEGKRKSLTSVREIVRNDKGRAIGLGDERWDERIAVGGTVSEILPDRHPTDREMGAAMEAVKRWNMIPLQRRRGSA